MRRILAAWLASAVLVAGAIQVPTPVRAAPADGITWTVDYEARTITVHVKMKFYNASRRGTAGAPLQAQVDQIVTQIKQAWEGKMYKCFTFHVDVQATGVEGGTQGNEDAVPVGLIRGAGYFRSDMGHPANNDFDPSKYLSNNPADRFIVGGDALWWSRADGSTFAHEFGHLLGLDDGYEDLPGGGKRRLEGAPADIMFDHQLPVTAATMNTLIGRSGAVDESKVKCDLKLKYVDPAGITWFAIKCDRPDGTWNIALSGSVGQVSWTGSLSAKIAEQTLSGQLSGTIHGSGPNNYRADFPFDATATVRTRNGQALIVQGTSGGSASVTVPHKGTGSGQTNDSGRLEMPLELGKFCH